MVRMQFVRKLVRRAIRKLFYWLSFSVSSASNSIWSVGNQTTRVISNPFATGDLWRPSANVVNNNTQSIDTSLCNPINPFKPVQFPLNNGKIFFQ